MFVTRVKQAATVVVAVSLLSGCLALPGGGGGGGDTPTARAPQSIRVAGGKVAITGPEGYCIDETGSSLRDTGAFVLLGSCRAISHNPDDPHPAHPMVLTASVAPGGGAADDAALDRLAGFFASDAGRAALSRSQDADTVSVEQVSRGDGALFLQVTDSSPNGLGAVDDTYWRGLFQVNDHMITVTATGFSGRPDKDQAGLRAVKSLAERILAANPTRGKVLAGLTDRLQWRNNSRDATSAAQAPRAAGR